MNEKLIVQIIEVTLAAAAVGGIAIIFAATLHDMRAIARKSRLQTIASGLTKANRLPVTILVYTHNNAPVIEACLESIVANNYESYKIIIADNASTDTTPDVIADYKKAQSKIQISVHTQKLHTDRPSILRAAYKKNRKNDLIFILDATDELSDATIRTVVAHFIALPHLNALRLHRQNKTDLTIRSLPGYFAALTINILNKTLSGHSVTNKSLDRSGTTVRSSVFPLYIPATKLSAMYDSRATYHSPNPIKPPIVSIEQRVMTLGLITGLLALIALMTYFFYTAATLRSNTLLALSWVLVSLWLLALIWSDEILAMSKKIALTFTLPFMYFLLYVQLFISVIALVRKLTSTIVVPKINFKNIHKAIILEAYSTRF